MYFRKTVHCWCVGSSWIDLPVRVFINCLFTLEMPQAILKFKKISDIVKQKYVFKNVTSRSYLNFMKKIWPNVCLAISLHFLFSSKH